MSERRYRGGMRKEPRLNPAAICFLESFTAEHPGCDVLEFGGGASTIWFLRQGCWIVCYESQQSWTEYILSAAANREIVTAEQEHRLDLRRWANDVPERLQERFGRDAFDVVLVDGVKAFRWSCLQQSIPLVRPGGVLMLDDAGRENILPDWDWTLSVQGTPDKYNVSRPNWKPGKVTAWWQRAAPLPEAEYYEVFCTRLD